MKIKLLSKNKILGIIFSFLLMAAGVITVVFGIVDNSKAALIMSIAVAVALFSLGGLYIASGCMEKLATFFTDDFAIGSVAIAVGVVFILNREIVPTILVYAISVTLISLGVVYLIRFILYLVANGKTKAKGMVKLAIFACLLGVLLIAAGVLAIIFKGSIELLIYIATGVILFGLGVAQLVNSVRK